LRDKLLEKLLLAWTRCQLGTLKAPIVFTVEKYFKIKLIFLFLNYFNMLKLKINFKK